MKTSNTIRMFVVAVVFGATVCGILVGPSNAEAPRPTTKPADHALYTPPPTGPAEGTSALATGPAVADGYLSITVDDYGSWASTTFGGGGDTFDPSGALAPLEATFTSGFFIFVDGAKRELLSDNASWQAVFPADATLTRAVTSPLVVSDTNADTVNDTAMSSFQVTDGGTTVLDFDLTQTVSVTVPGAVSTMTQTYVVTNNGTATVDIVMVRSYDGDLLWIGGDFADDEVGTDFNVGGGDRRAFQQEVARPATRITLRGATSDFYCGGKHGLTPPNGLPAMNYGTDTQVWDAFGIPVSWQNYIAGVGYNTDGVSGATPAGSTAPQDGFLHLEFAFDLAQGAQAVVVVEHQYGELPPAVCPNGACEAGEDPCNCPADCGAPPLSEAGACANASDDDCDGPVDCADPDCALDPVCLPPPNDNCVDRITITDGVTAYDTTLATTDGNAHATCMFDGQTYEDIWFNYVATCTGDLTISTCNEDGGDAGYDSDLVLYGVGDTDCSGIVCPPTDLEMIDCNDDAAGTCTASGTSFASRIVAPVTAGNCYKIRVGGWNPGDEGPGALSIACVAPIAPGVDLFQTPPGSTVVHWFNSSYGAFGGTPLPAGFFFPGSQPFDGDIPLVGNPIPEVDPADTIVERLAPAGGLVVDGPPVDVPIEIRSLSLRSVNPIMVNPGTQWNVEVCLSPTFAQNTGTMSIRQCCLQGGTFDSQLPVIPRFRFTQVVGPNPGAVVELDNGQQDILEAFDVPWVYQSQVGTLTWGGGNATDTCGNVTPGLPGTSNFFPSISQGGCSCVPGPIGGGGQRKVLTGEAALLASHGIQPANPKTTGVLDGGNVNADFKTQPLVNGQAVNLPLAKHFNNPPSNWAGVLFSVTVFDGGEMGGATVTAGGPGGFPGAPGTAPPGFRVFWQNSASISGITPPASVPILFGNLGFVAGNTTVVNNSDVDAKVEAWNIFHWKGGPGSTVITLQDSDYVYVPPTHTPVPGDVFGCPDVACECRGDVVGPLMSCPADGLVDFWDVQAIQDCVNFQEPPCPGADCDVNCDGSVDPGDVSTTQCLADGNPPEVCCPGGGGEPCVPPLIGEGVWVHLDFDTSIHLGPTLPSHFYAKGPTAGNIGVEHAGGPGPCPMKGDLNGDGQINVLDRELMLNCQGQPPVTPCQCADLDDDGDIDGDDLAILDCILAGNDPAFCNNPDIPTVTEWGIIVMMLLILTGGTVVFARRRAMLAGAGGHTHGVDASLFHAALFAKVLAATLTLVLIGFAAAIVLLGELAAVDVIGSLVCAPIFAFLVHLWILPRNG